MKFVNYAGTHIRFRDSKYYIFNVCQSGGLKFVLPGLILCVLFAVRSSLKINTYFNQYTMLFIHFFIETIFKTA